MSIDDRVVEAARRRLERAGQAYTEIQRMQLEAGEEIRDARYGLGWAMANALDIRQGDTFRGINARHEPTVGYWEITGFNSSPVIGESTVGYVVAHPLTAAGKRRTGGQVVPREIPLGDLTEENVTIERRGR